MIPLALGLGGPYDIAIIAGVVVLLFGGAKLAGIGKSAALGIKEFKSAIKDEPEAGAVPPSPAPKQDSDSTVARP
jgi:sec-independent protein translocase protein TatA